MDASDFAVSDHTDAGQPRTRVALAAFLVIGVLMGLDLADDARTGAEWSHLLVEGVIMAMAIAGTAALWRGRRAAEARAARLHVDLQATQREAVRYRAEAQDALRGLGEAIETQFERWSLTPAEAEIGLLLLKGLSHKEAANVRGTTEQTVRQQALTVYRKSGLRNRSELAAFFLEDLLLPPEKR